MSKDKLCIFDGLKFSSGDVDEDMEERDIAFNHSKLLLKALSFARPPLPRPSPPYLQQEVTSFRLSGECALSGSERRSPNLLTSPLPLADVHTAVKAWSENPELSGTMFGTTLERAEPLALKIDKEDAVVSVALGRRHCVLCTLQGKVSGNWT